MSSASSESSAVCPVCGQPVPGDAPDGMCPVCLMRQVLQGTGTERSRREQRPRERPSVEAVASAFPQWEMLGLIGHGGMGSVFKVRQLRLNRAAALKVIPASGVEQDPAFGERFAREGELLARLHHPNIVAVHDSGKSGEFYYLLMEYADGVNLRQAMRTNRFTPAQALAVVPKICEALQYAHEEGVLHRDIKPENILLDQRGRVKLADFGIAKLMHPSGANAEETGALPGSGEEALTRDGSAPGTPRYMAPEQAAQPREVDARADIYSLGVVLYELLTGELPTHEFRPPSSMVEVNPQVDEVVRQALQREREFRQTSAAELKTQLETATIAGPPLPAASGEEGRLLQGIPGTIPADGFDYRSRWQWHGWPLLHVTSGIDPRTRRLRRARGIVAFGDIAMGVFAFGGRTLGIFAFGGISAGIVSMGGVSVGVFSMGGLALAAGLAVGGAAIGTWATGGFALGWKAVGGAAAGRTAMQGGTPGLSGNSPAVENAMNSPDLEWLRQLLPALVPWMMAVWVPLLLIGVLVPWWVKRRVTEASAAGAAAADGYNAPLSAHPELNRFPRWWWGALLLSAAVPCLGMLLWFCYAMGQESGGWNPAAAEAVTMAVAALGTLAAVPGIWLWKKRPRPLGRSGSWQSVLAVGAGLGLALLGLLGLPALTRLPFGGGRPAGTWVSITQSRDWQQARAQAEEMLRLAEARFAAGMSGPLEINDARYQAARVFSAGNPEQEAQARQDWARQRRQLMEARVEVGLASPLELEQARLEEKLAEMSSKSTEPLVPPGPEAVSPRAPVIPPQPAVPAPVPAPDPRGP